MSRSTSIKIKKIYKESWAIFISKLKYERTGDIMHIFNVHIAFN